MYLYTVVYIYFISLDISTVVVFLMDSTVLIKCSSGYIIVFMEKKIQKWQANDKGKKCIFMCVERQGLWM